MDELSYRCTKFIANALDSDSDVVSYVARQMAFIRVGCHRRLAEMYISVAGFSLCDIAFTL